MTEATLKLTERLPEFQNLKGVDGTSHSSKEYSDKNILVVVFSCNHCPYVRAYENRIIALQRDYGAKGVQIIAINSNDTKNYPEDSFEKMVLRAKEKGFNFPYLRDEDQSVASRAEVGRPMMRGCRFADRCPAVMPMCSGTVPPLYRTDDRRAAACFLYRDMPTIGGANMDQVLAPTLRAASPSG